MTTFSISSTAGSVGGTMPRSPRPQRDVPVGGRDRPRQIVAATQGHKAALLAAGAQLRSVAASSSGNRGGQDDGAGMAPMVVLPAGTPEKTIVWANRIMALATTAAEPSLEDRSLAAAAARLKWLAQLELTSDKSLQAPGEDHYLGRGIDTAA